MLIGYITKEMYNNGSNRTLISPVNNQKYEVPLEFITTFDIGRKVYLAEDGTVQVETMKNKIRRGKFLFQAEKDENRPIVNIDMAGEYVEPVTAPEKLSAEEALKVNKDAIEQ